MEISKTFEAPASGYEVAEIETESLARIVNADGEPVGDLFAFVAEKKLECASVRALTQLGGNYSLLKTSSFPEVQAALCCSS